MKNIEKVNKVHPNGWCAKSFPKLISDLNERFELDFDFEGKWDYYGVEYGRAQASYQIFQTLITEQEYLDIVDDVDYDGIRFKYNNGEDKIYTLIKGIGGEYTWGLGFNSSFDKNYIKKRFFHGTWIKITPETEPIVEPIPEKTPLQLIEERVTALEAAKVKPVVTEDWKSVACLSYNDFINMKGKCVANLFCSNSPRDMQILKSTIKQKLSL